MNIESQKQKNRKFTYIIIDPVSFRINEYNDTVRTIGGYKWLYNLTLRGRGPESFVVEFYTEIFWSYMVWFYLKKPYKNRSIRLFDVCGLIETFWWENISFKRTYFL